MGRVAIVAYVGSDEPIPLAIAGELADLLEALEKSPDEASVVLFTGGATGWIPDIDREQLRRLGELGDIGRDFSAWHRVIAALGSARHVSVAAIDGPAVGAGVLLALACTFRLASERSTVGPVEFDLGIVGTESASHLVRMVTPTRATELLVTGRVLSSNEAKQVGIVTEVYSGDFAQRAVDWCAGVAELPLKALSDIRMGLANALAAASVSISNPMWAKLAQAVEDDDCGCSDSTRRPGTRAPRALNAARK